MPPVAPKNWTRPPLKPHYKRTVHQNELTEGSTLTSISNETLYVTREEDKIQINGIQIEGEAIPAGNSYVYVVPEVIPMLDGPIVSLHETTILVLLPTGEPLEGVTIEAQEGNGTVLGPFTTDENGAAIISHQNDTLTYVIHKEDYSNLSDGFLIEGADANGNLIFTDLNGDGVINADDRVNSEPYRYYLNYRNLTENDVTKICYMAQIEDVNVADIQAKWSEELGIYLTQVKTWNTACYTIPISTIRWWNIPPALSGNLLTKP